MTIAIVPRSANGSWRCAYLVLAIAAILAVASPARAAFAPLPIVAANPVDGSVIAPVTSPSPWIPVSIETTGMPASVVSLYIEVSTQNVLDQDGTLADDRRVDFVGLTRSDANPGIFSGSVNAQLWASNPGTHYWQVSATVANSDGSVLDTFVSPVYTIVVTVPPAPGSPVRAVAPAATRVATATPTHVAAPERPYRMTTSGAALAISRHDATARRVKQKCVRTSRVSFKCAVAWKDRLFQYAGTLRVTDEGIGQPRSTFVGRRSKLSCMRALVGVSPKHANALKVSRQACMKPWRW